MQHNSPSTPPEFIPATLSDAAALAAGRALLADQGTSDAQRVLNALTAALAVYHADDPERWLAEWR